MSININKKMVLFFENAERIEPEKGSLFIEELFRPSSFSGKKAEKKD
ncbi:MAG: hypothetical protein H7A25_20760 [Leptospiraceae bacterium]|nr:hypothetical protein [Leptospiraceae bacterium]MCP5502340.1 hypothetical protein [Leptospiraceae bacterium]